MLNSAAKVAQNFDLAKKKSFINYFRINYNMDN